MPGDSHSDIGYHGWRYLYLNDYYAYAKWDGEALVNIFYWRDYQIVLLLKMRVLAYGLCLMATLL